MTFIAPTRFARKDFVKPLPASAYTCIKWRNCQSSCITSYYPPDIVAGESDELLYELKWTSVPEKRKMVACQSVLGLSGVIAMDGFALAYDIF